MDHTEIQLFCNTFDVNQLTSQETRENLYLSINQLDETKLSEIEIRQNFTGIKVALGVFIQKFAELEGEVTSIKLQQVAYEAKMERLFMKGQMEIKELKQELTQMKATERQLEKVVTVAKLLKGNDYAPLAVKSMMKGITNGDFFADISAPEDFLERITWAQENGFRWNKNNRAPSKTKKQIEILEAWEMEFNKARGLSQEELTDRNLIMSMGKGAVAGAVMGIEAILGFQIENKNSLTAYNAYQKAVKLLTEKLTNQTNIIEVVTTTTNFSELVYDVFGHIDEESYNRVVSGLNHISQPVSADSVLDQLKIYFSIDLFPRFINTDGELTNPLTIVPKLHSGYYDPQLIEIINRYID